MIDKRGNMMNKQNNAYICPIIFGLILILIGLCIQIPGGALTTYSFMNGENTDNYVFDNKYSAIDEYVGGDAYNYIIGASLVAGKISGTTTAKAVFFVGGALCLCFGVTWKMLQKKDIVETVRDFNNTDNIVNSIEDVTNEVL